MATCPENGGVCREKRADFPQRGGRWKNTRPVVSPAGSAIFLHVSEGKPTSGCISLPEDDVKTLLRFIDHSTKITLVRDIRDLQEPDIQATIRAATGI